MESVTRNPSPSSVARAPAAAPPARLPAPSAQQAHQLAGGPPRGRKEGQSLGTTRRDVLLDPSRARGEGLAVTSSEAGAPSGDGVSATVMYFQALQENPHASEAELWTAATRRDYNYGGGVTTFQQPRAAAAPARDRGALPDLAAPRDNLRPLGPARRPAQRFALVIGNSSYGSNMNPLPGAKRDSMLMAGRFEARGYTVSHLEDLDTAATERAVRSVGEEARAGDELAIYYAGHGVDGDLTGVDSRIRAGSISPRVPASVPSGALGKALSAGAKLELVIDACESGPLQQRLAADHDHLGSAAAVDVQGIDVAALRRQELHIDAETTGFGPINLSNASPAVDNSFLPGETAIRERERAAAAKAAAAKAGGKPSGLGGVSKGR